MAKLYKNKYRSDTVRFSNWDYTNAAYYYITICTKEREYFFGDIEDTRLKFSEAGVVAERNWKSIPIHFPNVYLDEYIIMPNHLHGIIVIEESTNRRDEACLVSTVKRISPKPGSIPTIIGSYKSACTKEISRSHPNFAWQPRFYEHIVRTEKSLDTIRQYIRNNPLKWKIDKYNKKR